MCHWRPCVAWRSNSQTFVNLIVPGSLGFSKKAMQETPAGRIFVLIDDYVSMPASLGYRKQAIKENPAGRR